MAEQLFQIAAKAVVRNDNNEILMFRVPERSGNPEHWDLPGGRMDPGESLLDTLTRELKEEIGTSYIGVPKQLMAILTKITIPVNDVRIPLVFVIYEVQLPSNTEITLDKDGPDIDYQWFSPVDAAEFMEFKFTSDFCELIRAL